MDPYPARGTVRSRVRRALTAALAAAGALALSVAGVVIAPAEAAVAAPTVSAAVAGPAATPGTTTISATGAFSGTVPSGVCTVTATVLGAAGGSAGVASVINGNGAGARITATFPVVPGFSYSGTVGGGGGQPSGADAASTAGAAGTNGGGAGGTSGPISGIRHHGAGGGGYTELLLGGTTAVVAGGGGGGGGGHSTTTAGAGGDAGLPSGTGATAGSNGNNGKDTTATNPQPVVTGGRGGGTAAPGNGGTNSNDSSTNGANGSGRTGGAGGADPNPDAGGGGGGGYTGGGGGASTVGYNGQNGVNDVAGAGGGGGSSYIAPSIPLGAGISTPSSISSVAGAKIASGAGNGANGSVTLVWNTCGYDLSVDKSVSPASSPVGSTATWTVAITNNGPSAMTQGDTVTLTDTLPGAGATTITGISVSGGSNSVLHSGAITCSAAVGAAMPASLDCSRPYQLIGGGAASGVRGLNVGETLTITYSQSITEAAGTVLTNTATVTDRPTTAGNNTESAAITVIAPPVAVNDQSLGNALRTPVSLTVTSNDTGTLQPGSVVLWNNVGSTTIASPYAVAGQGTWTVAGDAVSFTPLSTFLGDPTPVHYRVSATNGLTATATVTITYVPVAVDDTAGPFAVGSVASLSPLGNDDGTFDVASLRVVNPSTSASALSVAIAGQGTWAVSGSSATFTPLASFTSDPSPISYRITDTTGDTVTAVLRANYVPGAVDDQSLGHAIGSTVNQSVLTNDTGTFVPGSLVLMPGAVSTLNVPGEGTWSIPSSGVVRFVPEPGFLGDPAPVAYRVTDIDGDSTTALVTVGYLPAAVDDSDLGNPFGTDVNVAVLGNDTGDFVAASVRILNGVTPVATLLVPGEGSWTAEVDGTITFHPEPGFLTDPAPVRYQVTDTTGDVTSAQLTVTYLPEAVDDAQGGLAIGTVATVPVLANDHGDWVPGSLRLIDPVTHLPVSQVTSGQGVWDVVGNDISFTPAPGFVVDPDPIDYAVTDTTGDTATATIELDYGPGAADDESVGNAMGDPVDVSVFDNDSGDFDDTTLSFSGSAVVTTLTVPGEGVWTVLPGGIVRFTPEPGFLVDPAPVPYFADDVTGDPAQALVTVQYLPAAADDSDLGNALGSAVNVAVLGNDTGDFAAGTVRLLNGATPVTQLVVPAQGTWEVQPDDTITFTPLVTFTVDPSAVLYQVTDTTGDIVQAQVTITYLPVAVDDSVGGLTIGSATTVPVLANDLGTFDASTVRLINPVTHVVASGPVTIAGQGTWSLGASGTIVFTPLASFLADPDPIDYRVTDVTGDTVVATITLDYVPAAHDDDDLGNVLGTDVDLSVFANDVGDFDAATLSLSGAGILTTLAVPGEGAWTVRAGGIVRFAPEPGFLGDPTPVSYYAEDVTGDPVDALLTVTYVPVAADDSDLGNALGTDVTVDVLGNDTGDFTPGSVRIMDGATPVASLHVAGQGTWTVAADDTITFAPDPGFLTDPDPVTYRVTDSTGDMVTAVVTITYLPEAADDSDLGNTIGLAVNVAVLGNDTGDFVAASVRVIDPGTLTPVVTLVVAGEGTWRANADGTITFTPEPGFLVDPDPVGYQATDSTGDTVGAQLTVTYLPAAAADTKHGNTLGTVVDVDPLLNDTGDFDVASVRLIEPGTLLSVLTRTVPGEGRWDVVLATGHVTFTPAPGFVGNPAAVGYRVTDTTGDTVQSTVTITYLPAAVDDSSLGNKRGTAVSLSILGNDSGALDVSTARLLSGSTPMMNMTVPGQGSWHMNALTGVVTFTPEPSFTGDPSPVPYRVLDVNGNVATANVTITYLQAALALTGMSPQTPLMVALSAIILGLGALVVSRSRRITARHRA